MAGTRRPVRPTGLQRHLPALGRLDSPVTTYYLLLGATLLLLVIGLVMVLSASAVTSLKDSGSVFTVFRSQLVFAVLGIPLMVLASRLPVKARRSCSSTVSVLRWRPGWRVETSFRIATG